MKVTVTASFDSVKKTIVMEGANVDYHITKGLLVVASDAHAKFPERRITIPMNRVLMIEEDDDTEYIWKKRKEMDAVKKNDESRKPDLIDALMLGAKMMEEFKEKNDPTHPSHYAQGGISVWDVIRAYTDGLNGVDAFNAGNAIKYILRWHHKNGIEDLEKAKVYIDELIKSQKEKEK